MTRRAACLALLLLVIPGLDGGVARGGSHLDPRAAPLLEAGGGGATVEIDKSEWQKQSFRHDLSPVDVSSLNHKPAG